MPISDSRNLFTDTETNRIGVTPDGAQLFRDTSSGMVFVGDGTKTTFEYTVEDTQ